MGLDIMLQVVGYVLPAPENSDLSYGNTRLSYWQSQVGFDAPWHPKESSGGFVTLFRNFLNFM